MLYTNLVKLKRLLKTGMIFPFGQCHVIHPYIHCLDTTSCCCDSVTEKWTELPWYDVRTPRWLTESSQYCHSCLYYCLVLTHGLALQVAMCELGYLWGLLLPVIWSMSVYSIMFPVYGETQVTFILISVWTHGLASQAVVSVVRAVNHELNKFQF